MADRNVENIGRLLGSIAMAGAAGGAGGIPLGRGKFGPGKAARPGGRVWEVEGNPNEKRDAGVVFIPGPAQENAGLNRTPENLESFVRQSEAEHEEALNHFMGAENLSPENQYKLGVRREEGLAKWWNDKDPRRPVTPTSSCVRKVRLGPNGDIYLPKG